MPRDRWKTANTIEIKKYLINNLKTALELMVIRLKKEKFEVNDIDL